MAKKIMIQGTMSSAGKSFIVTGLCRLFSNMGYKVAPFKSQNMALNSGVTPDGFEMGRAQIAQAEAARTIPDVRMNPILLKPNSDVGSQVIVMGKPIGNMKAREYYDYKPTLIPVIKEAFHSLEEEYDIIVVEGAGSPAEINLKKNDIVNMGLAKMLDIPVLLVGDIDLGGVFAQLLGTLEWLDNDEKDYIKGLIINKFRGDVTLLMPGIKMLEERVNKKVIGVVPYTVCKIDDEDSVSLERRGGNKDFAEISIEIIRLPHISNFTDFLPLERIDGVKVSYISDVNSTSKESPDLIIIPGTKNTISDLKWMDASGLSEYVLNCVKTVPVIGICGGYQILGKTVSDPDYVEINNDDLSTYNGLSLIDTDTVICDEKTLQKTEGIIRCPDGFFRCLDGAEYAGYEIHAGLTSISDRATSDIMDYESENGADSTYSFSKDRNVFGTYIHGIFDKGELTKKLIDALCINKGIKPFVSNIEDYIDVKDTEYEKAAKSIEDAIDLDELMAIM